MALDVPTKLSNTNHRQVLPDLRLLVHRLEGIDKPNIREAHDDILEACSLVEYVYPSGSIQAAACLMNRLPKIDDEINWATR